MQLAKHSQSHKNFRVPGNWDASPPVVSAPKQLWISSLLIVSSGCPQHQTLFSAHQDSQSMDKQPSKFPLPLQRVFSSPGATDSETTATTELFRTPRTSQLGRRMESFSYGCAPSRLLPLHGTPLLCTSGHQAPPASVSTLCPSLTAPHSPAARRTLPHNLHVIRLPPSWEASKSPETDPVAWLLGSSFITNNLIH